MPSNPTLTLLIGVFDSNYLGLHNMVVENKIEIIPQALNGSNGKEYSYQPHPNGNGYLNRKIIPREINVQVPRGSVSVALEKVIECTKQVMPVIGHQGRVEELVGLVSDLKGSFERLPTNNGNIAGAEDIISKYSPQILDYHKKLIDSAVSRLETIGPKVSDETKSSLKESFTSEERREAEDWLWEETKKREKEYEEVITLLESDLLSSPEDDRGNSINTNETLQSLQEASVGGDVNMCVNPVDIKKDNWLHRTRLEFGKGWKKTKPILKDVLHDSLYVITTPGRLIRIATVDSFTVFVEDFVLPKLER